MSSRKQSWKDLEPPSETDGQSVAPSDLAHADSNKRIKYGKPVQAAMGLFEEYCGSSTVHGVRYFTEKKRHWMERLWWILAFALALFYCGKLIQNVYIKWDQSPVIVSFAEKSTPVWEIPFPAVTICPETKANMSQLNFTHVYHQIAATLKPPFNITDEEDELMAAVVQICDSHLTDGFEVGTNFTNSSITDLLRDTAPSSNDTLFICKFRNTVDYCQKYFEEIMTEEGLCFTFNVLNGSELYNEDLSPDYTRIDHNMSAKFWNLEDGYDTSIEIDPQTYPYRVFGSGARVGLFVLLKLYEQNLEYICRGPVQGFKILLHTPGEVPQVSKHYFRVPLLQEVLVSVKPNMITTSEGLRHYEPNRRQCYFASERKLRFLKVYTQRNCELECLANFTLQACGCVKFSMPRDKDTPICGAAKIACYNEAEDNLLKEQFTEGLTLEPGAERVKACNCLPACTSITYDAEISQAPFDWVSLFNAYNSPLDEFPGMQPARLSIFFKENQFITSKRSELYGPTDFLANCGGLLGLFMGASFLSIVELLYFFSLRLCCNLRSRMHRKRKNKIADSAVPGIVVVKPNDDDKKE
ncbi:pickpocket protein 28-like isoform X2 [Bradysia coprophila]|uniref:pickpocket protein 28-like isoform X2 n=1 Tax=Bradysia coprophila TaxID=38358 RepID=UPI00187DC6D8|nr:pickpocket protein 28-like isoform X2 [Bradysia coprophila]